MQKNIKTGIIGFGLSGRVFHAPLLKALEGYKVCKVHTSRAQDVHEILPEAQIVSQASALFDDPEINLIINCTPTAYHCTYTRQALEAGKHVVVEKPFAVSTQECTDLMDLAQKSNRVLSVFHNRRWDSDFLTLKELLVSQRLGAIQLFESHFDRYRPTVRANKWREHPTPGAGILYDLGSHLIDQALQLFGMPEKIFADVESQKNNPGVVDYFHLILYYNKMRVILHGDSFNEVSPRFKLQGVHGTYLKYGLDPQETQLASGHSPLHATYGVEDVSMWGKLNLHLNQEKTSETVKPIKGDYLEYYRQLYQSVVHGTPPPVSAKDALNVIQIIECALRSAEDGKTITVS